jgi:hypothetical protein
VLTSGAGLGASNPYDPVVTRLGRALLGVLALHRLSTRCRFRASLDCHREDCDNAEAADGLGGMKNDGRAVGKSVRESWSGANDPGIVVEVAMGSATRDVYGLFDRG